MSLNDEMIRASRFVRDPRVGGLLASLGLTHGQPFGIDWVAFHGVTYEPVQDGGDACLILPVFEDGCLVDLAACAYRGRRIATRRHVGLALGERFIARAAAKQARLRLFADPWRWVRAGRRGAVVLDWSRASLVFDGIHTVGCDDASLARRVHATTRRMTDPPRLFIPNRRTH